MRSLQFVAKGIKRTTRLGEDYGHFSIDSGFISSSNGFIYRRAPIDFSGSGCPSAKHFLNALDTISEGSRMEINGERVVFYGESSRIQIPCVDKVNFHLSMPQHGRPLEPGFREVIKRVTPFTSEDASRLWSKNLCISEDRVLSTNNIVIARSWHTLRDVPDFVMSEDTAKSLLAWDEDPKFIYTDNSIDTNKVGFTYEDDFQLISTVIGEEWKIDQANAFVDKSQTEVGDWEEYLNLHHLSPVLEKASSFSSDKSDVICLSKGKLLFSTLEGQIQFEHDIDFNFDEDLYFNLAQLRLICQSATHFYPHAYPGGCYFFGSAFDGAILGALPT